jgi:hypothetical protein
MELGRISAMVEARQGGAELDSPDAEPRRVGFGPEPRYIGVFLNMIL